MPSTPIIPYLPTQGNWFAPDGLPLYASKAAPGLFPATAAARTAAERACADGLLRVVAPDPKGKSDVVAVTDKGRAFLLEQSSPRQVLEDSGLFGGAQFVFDTAKDGSGGGSPTGTVLMGR